jgi:hypothetical protein
VRGAESPGANPYDLLDPFERLENLLPEVEFVQPVKPGSVFEAVTGDLMPSLCCISDEVSLPPDGEIHPDGEERGTNRILFKQVEESRKCISEERVFFRSPPVPQVF